MHKPITILLRIESFKNQQVLLHDSTLKNLPVSLPISLLMKTTSQQPNSLTSTSNVPPAPKWSLPLWSHSFTFLMIRALASSTTTLLVRNTPVSNPMTYHSNRQSKQGEIIKETEGKWWEKSQAYKQRATTTTTTTKYLTSINSSSTRSYRTRWGCRHSRGCRITVREATRLFPLWRLRTWLLYRWTIMKRAGMKAIRKIQAEHKKSCRASIWIKSDYRVYLREQSRSKWAWYSRMEGQVEEY